MNEQALKEWIGLHVCTPLNEVVKWDRYVLHQNGSGAIYGWIRRDDGFYDFVQVTFSIVINDKGDPAINYNATTSSAKYSKWIGEKLNLSSMSHHDCISAKSIPHAELVKWQEEEAEIRT